jgi:hypothetical protein
MSGLSDDQLRGRIDDVVQAYYLKFNVFPEYIGIHYQRLMHEQGRVFVEPPGPVQFVQDWEPPAPSPPRYRLIFRRFQGDNVDLDGVYLPHPSAPSGMMDGTRLIE